MIFTDYSRFQKKLNRFEFETIPKKKTRELTIKSKHGHIFKQATIFEENDFLTDEKGKTCCKYGAWFVSDKDAVFLTPEELNELTNDIKDIHITDEKRVSH